MGVGRETRAAVAVVSMAIALFAAACSPTIPREMTAYVFNRSLSYQGSRYSYKYKVEFYPDGLIRSFQETVVDRSSPNGRLAVVFQVSRKGSLITQTYAKDEYQTLANTTFDLDNEAVLVDSVREGKHHLTRHAAADGASYRERGENWFRFDFGKKNAVEFQPEKQTYSYSDDTAARLPKIECQAPAYPMTFEIGRLADANYYIVRRESDVLVFESLRIEGKPFPADPAVSIVNFLMLKDRDWERALSIYPFIGGNPRR